MKKAKMKGKSWTRLTNRQTEEGKKKIDEDKKKNKKKRKIDQTKGVIKIKKEKKAMRMGKHS